MDSLHCNFMNETCIGARSVFFSPIEQFVKKALQQVTVYNDEPNWAQGIYFIFRLFMSSNIYKCTHDI